MNDSSTSLHNRLDFVAWLLGLPAGSIRNIRDLSTADRQYVAGRLADRGPDLEAEYRASLTAPVLSELEQAEAWLWYS